MHHMAMRVDDILNVLSEHGPEINARFGVGWLALFGSTARGDAGPESDLVILVEFRLPTFRNYMGLHRYLEGLLDRPVDLVSVAALRPPMKQEVLREARRVA